MRKEVEQSNDVVVKSDGSVWFTDPPLNIPAGQKAELTFSGIFRISTSVPAAAGQLSHPA